MHLVISGRRLPIDGLRHAFHREALEYWNRFRGTKLVPPAREIFPGDGEPFLLNTSVIDVDYDPLNFRYRSYGRAKPRGYERNSTGKTVKELPPAGLGALLHEQFWEVLDAAGPCLHTVSVTTLFYKGEYERLTLPASGLEGDVRTLLAVTVFTTKISRDLSTAQPDAA